MRNKEYLALLEELEQHLAQAHSVIDFLAEDFAANDGEFIANKNSVIGMFWTARTLLEKSLELVSGNAVHPQQTETGGKND